MDLISVIIPVYNCENYICQCLDSIINQTHRSVEIIVVNDGDDGVVNEICRGYKDKYPKTIKYLFQENKGVSVARNVGIENSTGDWIAFIDSDDWVDSDYLEILYNNAINYNADISICSFWVNGNNSQKKDSFLTCDNNTEFSCRNMDLIKSCIIPSGFGNRNGETNIGVPWGKLYKRELIKSNNTRFVPGLTRMQDSIFNLECFYNANKIIYSDKNLYHYRKNRNSATFVYRENYKGIVNLYLDCLESFLRDKNLKCEFEEIKQTKTFLLLLEILKLSYLNKGCQLSLIKKRTKIKMLCKENRFREAIAKCSGKYLNIKQKFARLIMQLNMIITLMFFVSLNRKIKTRNYY